LISSITLVVSRCTIAIFCIVIVVFLVWENLLRQPSGNILFIALITRRNYWWNDLFLLLICLWLC